MSRWMRLFALLCGLVGTLMAVAAGSPTGMFSDELDTDLYDCSVTLVPSQNLGDTNAANISLDWVSSKEYTRIAVTKRQIVLESIPKAPKQHAAVDVDITPGTPYRLTIMRRGNWLGLLHDNALLFRAEIPRPEGNKAGIALDKGWSVEDARIQRLEPVIFADNFMRTADENGSWVSQSGEWALKSAWDEDPKGNGNKFNNIIYAQNPFAWAGRNPNGAALCTAGKPFWEDYTFTVAMRPGADGAAGVAVNMTDAQNGLLIRWSPANDRGATGDRIALFKLVNGQQTLVTEDKGGYIPGHWYKLAVTSDLEGVSVLVDGHPRLTAKNITPWRGGIGFYTEGKNGAIFDDVTVYGRTLKKDLLAESQQSQINQRFVEDRNGMQEWSLRSDWTSFPGAAYQYLNRWDYFGDHWMTLTVRPLNIPSGQLWMVLNSDGKVSTSGYRAVMQLAGDPGKLTYTIYRETTALATKTTKPLPTNVDYSLRFWHIGTKIWLELDGEKVLEATDPQPIATLRPSYRAEGYFASVRDVMVLGRNTREYYFSDAPVDWLDVGTWMPTTRWACAPQWSFLSGWSRGDTMLWHKNRFTGNQSMEAFIGLKMEYPREREIYDVRYRDFAITICGDGKNARSGYAGIYGAPDAEGHPNQRTVLLRNGVEVASAYITVPGRNTAHRDWFDLALHKRGDTIEFWVEGSKAITFKDPQPIDGGVPAVWASDNGISIARVRMHFANPPQPRTDASVLIDDPWYPEWWNVGQPLKLDFPETWSTTGKSISLKVTRGMPDGETALPTVNNLNLSFTPKASGEHWYQVTATDGENTSPPYHLAMPVFNPALGRDDAHALVLYRFNEGSGNVVHDLSKVTPALDINIPQSVTAHWVTGQGLTMRGQETMLMTKNTASKLMAIAKSRAFTAEFWISCDTIYPPTGWSGCLLAWEGTSNKRNFAFGHNSSNFIACPPGGAITGNDANSAIAQGFRTSLQHFVVTWDGAATHLYRNGVEIGQRTVDWKTDQWDANAVILLGNQVDLNRCFLGTYYLVAIHDKCFSEAEITRHYNAGPSAK